MNKEKTKYLIREQEEMIILYDLKMKKHIRKARKYYEKMVNLKISQNHLKKEIGGNQEN
jgi:hypothetical protein